MAECDFDNDSKKNFIDTKLYLNLHGWLDIV